MDFPINIVPIKHILKYIISNIIPNPDVITFYHIIVGSKVQSISNITDPDTSRRRNHECPEIVKSLLLNPESQFSPEMIEYISRLPDSKFIIRQVLILIDPVYEANPEPIGLMSVISDLPKETHDASQISMTHTIEHNEHKKTTILSVLEPIIVPNDITDENILSILRVLKSFQSFYPIMVNLMKCSSGEPSKIYCDRLSTMIDTSNSVSSSSHESSNWIYVSKPNCLLIDSEIQFRPIITIDIPSESSSESPSDSLGDSAIDSASCPFDDSLDHSNAESKISFTKLLPVRWVNLKDDGSEEKLNGLRDIKEYFPSVNNKYVFLTTLLNKYYIEFEIYSIYKLWTFTLYTSDYKFMSRANPSSSVCKEMIANFNRMSIDEFVTNWKYQPNFRMLSPFTYGYDTIILNKYIDYFTRKYENHTGISYLGVNPTIVDVLKLESHNIFRNLAKYFPESRQFLSPERETMERTSLKAYMELNGLCL